MNIKALGIILVLFIVIAAIALLRGTTTQPSNSSITPTGISSVESPELTALSHSLPNAIWSAPQRLSTAILQHESVDGKAVHTTITSPTASLDHFEDQSYLKSLGYEIDSSLGADGPGSSSWGYKKLQEGKAQYILVSYRTKPTSTNPNQPIEFNCPCQIDVTLFISDPIADDSVGMANPASVNCSKVGGILFMQSRGDKGSYGLCTFDDGRACEEWALLRGTCPVGGVKTTGYDAIDQKYCAWLGGKTIAEPNATCTFADGSSCSTENLYNGTCAGH